MIIRRTHPIYRISILLIATIFLFSACAAAATPTPMNDLASGGAPPVAAPAAPREAMPQAPADKSAVTSQYSTGDDTAAQTDRMIVKNANLSIVVSDPGKSMDNISKLADEMGGFVVTANLYNEMISDGGQVPHATITLRVPADRLNEAMGRIKSESTQAPLNESVNSQDVTSEYVDLQSQLKNLEAAEAQLTEIMGSATKTEDVLNVYNQLVQVRGQIEQTKGRMKYLEQTSALSAISVDLVADKAVQPLKLGGWQPVGTAKSAVQALIKTMQSLGSIIIWLVIYILPVLLFLYLIFVLPLTLVLRAWRKRRSARKAGITPAAPPAE